MAKKEKKSIGLKWKALGVIIVMIVVAGLFGSNPYTSYIKDDTDQATNTQLTDVDDTTEIDLDNNENIGSQPIENTDYSIVELDRLPAFDGADYSEEFPTIQTQPAYIAVPLAINIDNPPHIVIYSHGSNTRISANLNDPFMSEDIRSYADFFTDKNYIFAASDQHGQNWGNAESVADMVNLIQYINENYTTTGDIYLIGYSMGGLPTWNFMFEHPENIVKTAMLAPTSYTSNYGAVQFETIKEIPIKIWHGTADANIYISMSEGVVNRAKQFGKEIDLVSLPGKTHWDVDTELQDEIGKFFEE